MVLAQGNALGVSQGFLEFGRQFVKSHQENPPSLPSHIRAQTALSRAASP
jgi:hypothetical protein